MKKDIIFLFGVLFFLVIVFSSFFKFSGEVVSNNADVGLQSQTQNGNEVSAEQLCISKCAAEIDLTIICRDDGGGETGQEICQRCASQCVYLYEGPCLDDEKLMAKEKECETCEYCYGEPVEGPSGQGWNCIVDVECKDASAEFGE